MPAPLLLRPIAHGAVGPWDEIFNLIPLVVGAILLLYLYYHSRRKHADVEQAPDPHSEAEQS